MIFGLQCKSFTVLTKFNKGVGPHGAADAFGFIGNNKLLLQLVQEAEGQHVRVVCRAHHDVPDAQRAGETETQKTRPDVKCFSFTCHRAEFKRKPKNVFTAYETQNRLHIHTHLRESGGSISWPLSVN